MNDAVRKWSRTSLATLGALSAIARPASPAVLAAARARVCAPELTSNQQMVSLDDIACAAITALQERQKDPTPDWEGLAADHLENQHAREFEKLLEKLREPRPERTPEPVVAPSNHARHRRTVR